MNDERTPRHALLNVYALVSRLYVVANTDERTYNCSAESVDDTDDDRKSFREANEDKATVSVPTFTQTTVQKVRFGRAARQMTRREQASLGEKCVSA